TIDITSDIAASGFGNVLMLIVLISVNLAIFNLLPVPALDGCKMLFVIIEWIRHKPINRKIEGIINIIGFVFLIGFAILVDLLKL
ncbi:MAG: site-2 protease family protein, partial [Clostridia bacterium]